jgi:hypothetical protein
MHIPNGVRCLSRIKPLAHAKLWIEFQWRPTKIFHTSDSSNSLSPRLWDRVGSSYFVACFVKRIAREEGKKRYEASAMTSRISRALLTLLVVTVVTVVVLDVTIVVGLLRVTV